MIYFVQPYLELGFAGKEYIQHANNIVTIDPHLYIVGLKANNLHSPQFYFDNKGIAFSTILRPGILIVSYISLVKFDVKPTSRILSLVLTINRPCPFRIFTFKFLGQYAFLPSINF